MDVTWENEFRKRMVTFEGQRPPKEGEVSVSIKLRVISGCFHRDHSPKAYGIIDKHLSAPTQRKPEFAYLEHESGPEVIVYLALATAGATLAKSVLDLIAAIIRARSEGIGQGDRPDEPLELIVRRVDSNDRFIEETVLRVGHTEPVDTALIEAKLRQALARIQRDHELLPKRTDPQPTTGPHAPTRRRQGRKH